MQRTNSTHAHSGCLAVMHAAAALSRKPACLVPARVFPLQHKGLKKAKEVRTQLLDIMQQHKVPIVSAGTDWDTVRKVGRGDARGLRNWNAALCVAGLKAGWVRDSMCTSASL